MQAELLPVFWPLVGAAGLVIGILYALAAMALSRRDPEPLRPHAPEIADWWGLASLWAALSGAWTLMFLVIPIEWVMGGTLALVAMHTLHRSRVRCAAVAEAEGMRVEQPEGAVLLPWDDLMVLERPRLIDVADGKDLRPLCVVVSLSTGVVTRLEPDRDADQHLRARLAQRIARERWVTPVILSPVHGLGEP